MIPTTPPSVMIAYTNNGNGIIKVVSLPENETAEIMASRLKDMFLHGKVTIHNVYVSKAVTEADYQLEWMSRVAGGFTTKGLVEWHQDKYGIHHPLPEYK